MRSLLGVPAFNSCLFESTSSRATLWASILFHRRFCIPGVLELSQSHGSNPGIHPATHIKKMNSREGTPKDMKLDNGERTVSMAGSLDRGCPIYRTLRSCKTWLTCYPSRPMRRSHSRRLQCQTFLKTWSRSARSLHIPNAEAGTYASRVAFPNHKFTSIRAENPDLLLSRMSFHLFTILWRKTRVGIRTREGIQTRFAYLGSGFRGMWNKALGLDETECWVYHPPVASVCVIYKIVR